MSTVGYTNIFIIDISQVICKFNIDKTSFPYRHIAIQMVKYMCYYIVNAPTGSSFLERFSEKYKRKTELQNFVGTISICITP